MMVQTNMIAALKAGAKQFSPQMKRAAKYAVDHPSDFGLDPIRETARKAQVSTYTFVNMAKSLGFPSFEALRQPFRQALVAKREVANSGDWFGDMQGENELGQVYARAAQNALAITESSLEHQKLDDLEAIADMLTAAKTVYLTAVRSSYAVAYYLHYVGRMALPSLALIPRHSNSAIDDLNEAGPGDVLIAVTVAPYSRDTMKACAFAKKNGAKLLLITDAGPENLPFEVDYRLCTSAQSAHNFGCFSGMMAVTEGLIAILLHRVGQPAQDRISTYEALRIENSAYWEPEK